VRATAGKAFNFRKPPNTAPSWSWVSVDGIPAAGLFGQWELLATVIDLDVELKGENPYGAVKSGWIKLFLAGNEEEYREEAEWKDVEEDEEGSGEEDQWKDKMEDEGGDTDDVARAYPFIRGDH
jgi:hypothetical protein